MMNFSNSLPRSRGAILARALRRSLPPKKEKEGAGNAGCRLAPAVSCAYAPKNAHTSIQVERKQSGIPCAVALRLMPRSPWRRIRLVTIIPRIGGHPDPVGSKEPPRTWHQQRVSGPRGFAVRVWRRSSCAPCFAHGFPRPVIHLHARRHRVHRNSRPTFPDDRDTPLAWAGMCGFRPLICPTWPAEFCPSCQSVAGAALRADAPGTRLAARIGRGSA
jgi:hypothetical protein